MPGDRLRLQARLGAQHQSQAGMVQRPSSQTTAETGKPNTISNRQRNHQGGCKWRVVLFCIVRFIKIQSIHWSCTGQQLSPALQLPPLLSISASPRYLCSGSLPSFYGPAPIHPEITILCPLHIRSSRTLVASSLTALPIISTSARHVSRIQNRPRQTLALSVSSRVRGRWPTIPSTV